MLADASALQTLRLSSQIFAKRDRTEAFRELCGRGVLKLEFDSLSEEALEVDMLLRMLPGLAVATAQVSPLVCRHTASMIDNDDPVIVFMQSGSGVYGQNGRETAVSAGDVLLTTNGLAGTAHLSRSSQINWRISRQLIEPMVPNFDAMIGGLLDKNNPAVPLFLHYLSILNDERQLAEASTRRAVATHLLDLAALILGPRWDAAEVGKNRGLAAARLHSIKAQILSEIASPNLSLTSAAKKAGISPAYVRKLFDSEGTSFTEFVVSQRLARAYRGLTDPRFITRSVGDIARMAGFNDIAYFNRIFRRAYGMTPSGVRGEFQSKQ